jgi:hypothetical protein
MAASPKPPSELLVAEMDSRAASLPFPTAKSTGGPLTARQNLAAGPVKSSINGQKCLDMPVGILPSPSLKSSQKGSIELTPNSRHRRANPDGNLPQFSIVQAAQLGKSRNFDTQTASSSCFGEEALSNPGTEQLSPR